MAALVGPKFGAIDTYFSRHWAYDGDIWVLVTRNSNNKICVPAYGLSPQEQNDGVEHFITAGKSNSNLTEYLRGAVLYTDGGPSLPRFAEGLSMKHKRCFRHLIT